MFKKKLYSFCALIALTCGANAMEDDLSSSEEKKGGRNALRASTASLGINDQEPAETSQSSPVSSTQDSLFSNDEGKVTFTWPTLQQAGGCENPNPNPKARVLYGFLVEMLGYSRVWNPDVVYELPILPSQIGDDIGSLFRDKELSKAIRKAIEKTEASSPANLVPNSLFSNDDAKATFTWGALMAAVEKGESRARNLHEFLMQKYMHDEIRWDEKPFYKMPFSQKQLDEDIWTISEPFEMKLGIAVGNIPTTREAISKLAAAINHPVNDTVTHKDREIELRTQALKAVDTINALKEKLSSTEDEYTAFRAIRLEELTAKEEAEKQLASKLAERETELEASRAQTLAKATEAKELTSQLAALKAEVEAFKAESQKAAEEFKAIFVEKTAQNQLLQGAVNDVKATLAAAAERLASLPAQTSEASE